MAAWMSAPELSLRRIANLLGSDYTGQPDVRSPARIGRFTFSETVGCADLFSMYMIRGLGMAAFRHHFA